MDRANWWRLLDGSPVNASSALLAEGGSFAERGATLAASCDVWFFGSAHYEVPALTSAFKNESTATSGV